MVALINTFFMKLPFHPHELRHLTVIAVGSTYYLLFVYFHNTVRPPYTRYGTLLSPIQHKKCIKSNGGGGLPTFQITIFTEGMYR